MLSGLTMAREVGHPGGMADAERWKTLPPPVRIADTTASQAPLEYHELLPDQQELDKQWAVKFYG